jgi:hypothetical protein
VKILTLAVPEMFITFITFSTFSTFSTFAIFPRRHHAQPDPALNPQSNPLRGVSGCWNHTKRDDANRLV